MDPNPDTVHDDIATAITASGNLRYVSVAGLVAHAFMKMPSSHKVVCVEFLLDWNNTFRDVVSFLNHASQITTLRLHFDYRTRPCPTSHPHFQSFFPLLYLD